MWENSELFRKFRIHLVETLFAIVGNFLIWLPSLDELISRYMFMGVSGVVQCSCKDEWCVL